MMVELRSLEGELAKQALRLHRSASSMGDGDSWFGSPSAGTILASNMDEIRTSTTAKDEPPTHTLSHVCSTPNSETDAAALLFY